MAGSAVPAGAVNLQAKSAAKLNPAKGTWMIADAVIEVAEVKLIVTVTGDCFSEPVDKVTAALVSAPTAVTATRDPEVVESKAVPDALAVLIATSVFATCAAGLVKPVQVKVKVEPAAAPAVTVMVKTLVAKAAELVRTEGEVMLQTGEDAVKPVKVTLI